jgi:hypothetical protein
MKPYRSLSPVKEGKRKYRFATNTELEFPLFGHLATHPDCVFSENGKEWARITEGFLYIAPNYAWDGCTPKKYIGIPPLGAWVGTPDFEETILPSLVHDVLFQFAKVGKYSFDSANYQFYIMMVKKDFKLASVYYKAVNDFGSKFWKKRDQPVEIKFL